jgi:SAM-dependent methyltransferase
MNDDPTTSYGGYDDIDAVGELYDQVPIYTSRPDQEFYLDAARAAAGKILEVGCGTGRVLVPTARLGREVVGLDRSHRMLARCREKVAQEPDDVRRRVRLHEGDMRDFDLGEQFALATIPFRPFQHLITTEDQIGCLRSIHRHLAPGGLLVFDVFNPDLGLIAEGPWAAEREDTPETGLPDGRRFRRTARVAATHRAEQWNEIEIAYYVTHPGGRAERLVQAFPMRWFLRYEVEHLLARCGFALGDLYGDFGRRPFGDESPEMIFVAARQ